MNPLTQDEKLKSYYIHSGVSLSPICALEASLATLVIFPTFPLLFLPHFPLGLRVAALVHVWVSHKRAMRRSLRTLPASSFSPPFSHLHASCCHRPTLLPSSNSSFLLSFPSPSLSLS